MIKSAARKLSRPASKPAAKAAKPKPAKAKLAKVTRFPMPKKTPPPPPKKASAPPLPAKKPPVPPQLPALTRPSQVQQPKQSLARSFYWSELRVGDDLPPLTKPAIDRVQIIRYASSSGDFNRLHVDEPYSMNAGFPGLFAPGMLPMAFIGQLLSSWLRRGHVRKLSARFIKLVWPGDELTCRGRIADLRKEHSACYADVELWAENQKGELVLRGHATCELYEAPATGTAGDGGGLLFALQQSQQGGALPQVARKPAVSKPPPAKKPAGKPAKKK